MEHACVNPYCSCDDCDCDPPCSCGLALVGHTTDEVWDAGTGELRYTVTSRFRHDPGPRRRGSEYDDVGGGHGHGDHGGRGHDRRRFLEHGHAASCRDRRTPRPARRIARRRRPPGSGAGQLSSGADGGEHSHGHPSVRTAEHNGHTIEIRTTYDVRIDGEPMEAHLGVGNDGNVHYHGLPNYSEASAIDLMRRVIDAFPDDYPPADDHDHEEG